MKKVIYITIIILTVYITFQFLYFRNIRNYTQSLNNNYKMPLKYNNLSNIFKPYAKIPGLKEGAVPQGLVYYEPLNIFLISSYHKKHASLIHVIDYKTGKLLKSIKLYTKNNKPYKGHVGGITIIDNKVLVSSKYEIYEYSLHDILDKNNMEYIKPINIYKIDNKGDYIFYQEGIIWVGEYNYKNLYKTKKEHYLEKKYKSLLFGYQINDNKIDFNNIKYVIAMPERVQSIYFLNEKIYVSRSFWSFQDSQIEVYENPLDKETKDEFNNIPLYYLNNYISSLNIPPMSEGISIVDNNIYILFESNSNKFKYYTKNKIDYISKIDIKYLD